jgi:hypothetical protein
MGRNDAWIPCTPANHIPQEERSFGHRLKVRGSGLDGGWRRDAGQGRGYFATFMSQPGIHASQEPKGPHWSHARGQIQ